MRISLRLTASTALAVLLPALAHPAAGQPTPASDLQHTRVTVSRREVRVEFPPDTARAWGWPGEDGGDTLRRDYRWSVSVAGVDRPLALNLLVQPADAAARTFPSLAALVAAGEAAVCTDGQISQCTLAPARAHVQGKRVVLTVRDSAIIARLFGLRPERVHVARWRPRSGRLGHGWEADSIPVRYARPVLPEPDPALRAASARAWREHAASRRSVHREIGPGGGARHLWVAVADSVPLEAVEWRCTGDHCERSYAVADSGWSLSDTAVARLAHVHPDSAAKAGRRRAPLPARYLVGLRPGRTTVRVVGLHGASDTLPSRTAPERTLEREVRVSHPIARLELLPEAWTVEVRRPLAVQVRAVDVHGTVVDDAPADLLVDVGGRWLRYPASGRVVVSFAQPGTRLLRALLAGKETEIEILVTGGPPDG